MEDMLKTIRTAWLRPDTIALSIAALIVIVALVAAASVEMLAAQAPVQSIALTELASSQGLEVMLPFLVVTGVVLLAGVAVVAGRRKLAK